MALEQVNDSTGSYSDYLASNQNKTVRPPAPPTPDQGLNLTKRDTGTARPGTGDGWQWGTDQVQALLAGLNGGQSGQGWLDAYNNNFGLQTGSSLAYYPDQNIYALPSGYATLNNGQWTWNPRSGASTGGGQMTSLPQVTPFTDPRQAQADELFNFLMGRMGQSLQVSPDDPVIKAQSDAYAAKAMNQWRNTASEIAAKGGANYNPEAENRSIAEQLAQSTGEFTGKLMSDEVAARRGDINNAIAQGAGLLTAEQQMALQDRLTQLDEQMKLYGINMGDSEFMKSLMERSYEFDTGNSATAGTGA